MKACQERSTSPQNQNLGGSLLSFEADTCREAENHLQSLGFIMNNGRARFKLDDSTCANSNVSPTDFSMIDEDEPLSFVVLGKDSMDCIQASSLASYVDIQQKSMSADYNSMISSLNTTEIYQKVNELLQENGKLKETLKQNNVAMKYQFNTLATWQEEIVKIQQNHKKKFVEMRELINFLKKENAELKLKLSSDCTDNTETGYKIINTMDLEDEGKETTSNSAAELQKMVSSLTDELNSYRVQCAELTSDLEKLRSIQNLTSSQLEQATLTIQEQRNNIKKLELASMQPQSSGSNFTNAESKTCEKCISKDKKICDLEESILSIQASSKQKVGCSLTSIPFEEIKSLKFEDGMKNCDRTLQEQTNSVNSQINCDDELKKYLETQKISNDKSSLENEKEALAREKEAIEEEKKLIAGQKRNLETEHKSLNDAKELLQQERMSLQEEKASLDQQSQLYEDHEKSLQMEKKQLEGKYEQLVTEINTLLESLQRKEFHIQQLQVETKQAAENCKLLEIQLKLYEEDFTQEKKVKETLLEEKNKVNADLQKQMELNKRLQEELQDLKGTQECDAVVITPVMSTFTCPKCDCNFRDLDSVERHVQVCLNLD